VTRAEYDKLRRYAELWSQPVGTWGVPQQTVEPLVGYAYGVLNTCRRAGIVSDAELRAWLDDDTPLQKQPQGVGYANHT